MAMDPRRTQVVVQQLSPWEVKFFDVTECSWICDWRNQTIWEKCHSNMFILGNAGNENFSIDVRILGHQVVEKDGKRHVDTWEKDMLVGNKGDKTFKSQGSIRLNVGLTVLFWCHKKIHPSFWKTKADRDNASLPHRLKEGLHMQMTPGEGEVWDTYLLTEHTRGYSGRTDASPICRSKIPLFTTDRISLARKEDRPAHLFQLAWKDDIRSRIGCECPTYGYPCQANLPWWKIPGDEQLASYFYIAVLEDPSPKEMVGKLGNESCPYLCECPYKCDD
jgi:hypothetical protein